MIPFSYFALVLFPLINSFISLSKSSTQFNPIIMPGKRNFSAYSLSSGRSDQERPSMGCSIFNRNKKLRRLPHVFSKVLELPFNSDADVSVEEQYDCLRFIAKANGGIAGADCVRANVFEVHPGITKVLIGTMENPSHPSIEELELDVWRYRLPPSARPEFVTAFCARGQLVVTVPKNEWSENNSMDDNRKGRFKGNMGNLVLVQ